MNNRHTPAPRGRPPLLRAAARWARAVTHPLISHARGGRGVRIRPGGWPIAVHPRSYLELRYWLRYEAATWGAIRRVWRPGMNVVDVGAHHGIFGLCFFRPGARPPRMVSVEPSPEAAELLAANRKIHPEADWTIVPRALAAAPGRLQLHRGWTQMLVADPSSHPGSDGRPVEVPATTLDGLCAELELRPDLIKIDVEGFEAEVLAGATETLRLGPIILLELHWAMLRNRGIAPETAVAPLATAGYRMEPYEVSDSIPLTSDELVRRHRDWGAPNIVRLLCRAGDE